MKKHVGLMLVISLVSGLSFAQQEENVEPKENTEEHIEVLGQRTPTHFYKAMRRAEINLYDQVNQYIDEHKYKVSCHRESQANTNLKRKNCLPNFVRERMAFETQKALDDGAILPTLEQVEALLGEEQEEAMNAVAKVIEENPKLLELLVKYHTTAAKYENIKAQYASDENE